MVCYKINIQNKIKSNFTGRYIGVALANHGFGLKTHWFL